ncbi:hypothetical protein CH367_11000 [Leptospira barantonii]|uniref:DUF6817 domain-containing protein n=2 Tax=Leptospira barantonii TaxID=2023184 RepID=A0ABX4NNH1_9LEPT|nr:hypothetical protein CH367_11000 [Leptospira barantonii]
MRMEPDPILLDRLKSLHAQGKEHLHGDLLTHLTGTFYILVEWGSSIDLCNAGLYHAVYGTFAFQDSLLETTARKEVENLIGSKAETLVYLYGTCDRNHLYAQFGNGKPILHKNRLTDEVRVLEGRILNELCELTAANELQLATADDKFLKEYGPELKDLFERMDPYLSKNASNLCKSVFLEY